jgi:cyclohexanecarboxylate-CoA ligase
LLPAAQGDAVLIATHPNPHAESYRSGGHWPQRSLPALFAETVRAGALRGAITDGAAQLTFGDLEERSRRIAAGFRQLGIAAGDVVAYQLPNWWEAVVVFLATLRVGAVVHPLLPSFREAELRFTLRQTRARLLVIPGRLRDVDHRELIAGIREELPDLAHVLVARAAPGSGMHMLDDFSTSSAPLTSDDDTDPDAVALAMYTSGSTAEPKGVLHTHNSLAAEVMSLRRVHQLTAGDRTLMPSPLTHISGVIHAILTPALLGTSAVLMERWNAAQAAELIRRMQVTYMVGVPTVLQDLLALSATGLDAENPLPSLRLFSCGGAEVSADLVRAARQCFSTCTTKRVYGSTEFPTIATTDASSSGTRGIDSDGQAIPPNEVRIVDVAGTPLPPGVEGEVQARGPECFVGYLDPILNEDAFSVDGWFRTGDLGVLDEAGYLQITGRLKEIVIRKGEKISVREVEELVATHPAVAEVAVVALPDPSTGERACAAIRVHPGKALDLPGLRAHLAARGVARQKWPEEVRLVAEFPRTDSGKIWRRKLAAELGRRT